MKQMDFFFPGFVFFFLIETEWEKKNFGNTAPTGVRKTIVMVPMI